ncbi:MAG: radical SAM family heme chaperone HemW [Clostridiales bacterium]|nr:radical SAM family heme chaperone HemW [Clostridiales bacterium]
MLPLSLYVHIPFCKSKCSYCDFCSFPASLDDMNDYCQALIKEIHLQGAAFSRYRVHSIFIGGGTPTFLPPFLLSQIIEALFHCFSIDDSLEFTCEANPETVTTAYLCVLHQLKVNRLSLGAQAYQPHLLQMLGRIHSWQQVENSVYRAIDAGITNVNIDLMFGLPTQTPHQWLETLQQATALPITHLSCYGLIVEENTLIQKQLSQKQFSLPHENEERAMYDLCLTHLPQKNFFQYEISNFSKPGHACKHNLSYWKNQDYLGLGLNAHSKISTVLTGNPQVSYTRFSNPDN